MAVRRWSGRGHGLATRPRWPGSSKKRCRPRLRSRWSDSGDCLLRLLRNGDSYLSVLTNGAARNTTCSVQPPGGLMPASLWGDAPRRAEAVAHFDLAPLGTSVVSWTH